MPPAAEGGVPAAAGRAAAAARLVVEDGLLGRDSARAGARSVTSPGSRAARGGRRLVAVDVSVQGEGEPTGVERAQAVLLDALLGRDDAPRLLLATPWRVPARWRDQPRVVLAEGRAGAPSSPRAAVLARLAWRQLALPRVLRREGAELLHAPVVALPRRLAVPAVATVHEVPWAGGDGGLGDRSPWHRRALLHAAARAAALVCPSRRTADDLLALHPAAAERVVVLPHAVDPRFSPGEPEPLPPGVPAGGPLVLAVGRLRRKKNLLRLLDALALLRASRRPAPVLVLAGPHGDASAELAARARRSDLAGGVVFTGFVDDERLVALYRRASVVALPSLFEGFGLPGLEALACGTPVVAARQGALPEAAREGALLADGEDVAALAAAVATALAGGPPTRELLARGRERCAQLAAHTHADAVLRLWGRLAGWSPA